MLLYVREKQFLYIVSVEGKPRSTMMAPMAENRAARVWREQADLLDLYILF